MRPQENYTSFYVVGLGFALAILVSFHFYNLREPYRIRDDERADLVFAISAGEELFAENCINCHGEEGEGESAPALNSKELLNTTLDEVFFSLTRSGVPGTAMPAWGQAFGGPLTDEETNQLVAFMRNWEETAPLIVTGVEVYVPDPLMGAITFSSICFICHGENGVGTDVAPAIYDAEKLNTFDDDWYRTTITQGRPAQGMPTWGTVLSPNQIEDLIALLASWREGAEVEVLSLEDQGEILFQETAGRDGCQECHGEDALGLEGPNIRGKTVDNIVEAINSFPEMEDMFGLTPNEIEAIAAYLATFPPVEE